MSQTNRPTYLLIHLSLGQDTTNGLLFQELSKNAQLNTFVQNGASQLLIREADQGSLSSLLSFEQTWNDLTSSSTASLPADSTSTENAQTIAPSNKFIENEKVAIKAGEFDEEQSEIKFIKAPTQFSAFSNNLQTILLTNNQSSSVFANKVKLNYQLAEFSSEQKILELFENEVTSNELIIIDALIHSAEDLASANNILNSTKRISEIYSKLFVNVIIDPFLNESQTQEYLNPEFRLQAISDQNARDFLSTILPIQTWQTYQGQIDEEFINSSKQSALSIFYDQNGCRQDKLTSFAEIAEKGEKLRLLGFSHIKAIFFFREITFKLGKLPKYGA